MWWYFVLWRKSFCVQENKRKASCSNYGQSFLFSVKVVWGVYNKKSGKNKKRRGRIGCCACISKMKRVLL